MAEPRAAAMPAVAVAIAAAFWGAWWIPLRALDAWGIAGDWSNATLSVAGALVMLPIAAWRWRPLLAGGRGLLAVTVFAGAAFAAYNHALIHGEVVRATLLFYLAPIWATGLAALALEERLGPGRALALVLGLAGAAVVLGIEDGVPIPRDSSEWLGLASGLLFAITLTFIRKAESVPAFETTFASIGGSALAALALAFASPLTPPPPATELVISSLPFVVAVTALWLVPMTILELWGARRMDPGRVCIVLMLEIVVAAASATALTDEPFGWREALGSALIISAGFVELRDQTGRTAAAPTE